MSYPTIRRFTPSGAVGNDTQSIFGVSATTYYSMRAGDTSATAGLRSYLVTDASQSNVSPVATVFGANNNINAPLCVVPTGQIFLKAQGWGDGSAEMALVDPTTLALLGAWNGGNVGGGDPYAPLSPQTFGATSRGTYSYVACAKTSTLVPAEVYVMQAGPTLRFAGCSFNPVDTVHETQFFTGPGPVGKAYAISCGANTGFSTACGVYEIDIAAGAENYDNTTWPTPNAHISHSKLGSFLPSNVDVAWTTMNYVTAPAYDNYTGNLIVFCRTADSVTHKTYCVMLSKVDGSVVWANAVSDVNERFSAMPASNINGGFYNYLQGQNLYQINTVTGAMTTTVLGSVGLTQACSIDNYANNEVLMFGQWLSATAPPTAVGGITPTATSYWYGIQLGAAPSPPSPPSVASGGYAYFIERMDNRIWPTIESAWCLDAALANTMPAPAGTLTISSATGGHNIGLYNIINGGAGYTAPIGQIVDLAGPGTGASVSLTVAGGIITVATASTTGSGYVQPQLTVLDATGVGAVVQPIVTNYVTVSCSTASFSASNVGDIIRAGGGKIQVTTYGTTASTTTTVTGNIITPITATIPNDPNNTPMPVASGNWTMTTPTTSVRGLSHLEGKTVYALADGGVVRNLTVSNGAVTLPVSASQILVGLQYDAQLQTMYMEAGGGQTLQTRRKDETQVVLRVDNSAAPQVGTNQPDAAAQPNGATVPWTNMVDIPFRTPAVPAGQAVPLYSGDLPITNVFSTWDARGQIAVQQRDPVPLTLVALIPWVSIGDTPSGS